MGLTAIRELSADPRVFRETFGHRNSYPKLDIGNSMDYREKPTYGMFTQGWNSWSPVTVCAAFNGALAASCLEARVQDVGFGV